MLGQAMLAYAFIHAVETSIQFLLRCDAMATSHHQQVYTIACHELVGRDPPGRRALCSFLSACDAPAALLQHRFLCVSQRVAQILELVAAPALARAGSAEALAATQVLDTFHCDAPGTMGAGGLSVERTYQ